MSDRQRLPLSLGWLELLLVLAVVSLFFQVFPSLWLALLAAIDPRGWSRATWFAMNLVVLAVLFAMRFGPELYADWRTYRARLATKRRRWPQHADPAADDPGYESRARRDAEWRERAKRRRPWM